METGELVHGVGRLVVEVVVGMVVDGRREPSVGREQTVLLQARMAKRTRSDLRDSIAGRQQIATSTGKLLVD